MTSNLEERNLEPREKGLKAYFKVSMDGANSRDDGAAATAAAANSYSLHCRTNLCLQRNNDKGHLETLKRTDQMIRISCHHKRSRGLSSCSA